MALYNDPAHSRLSDLVTKEQARADSAAAIAAWRAKRAAARSQG